MCLYTVSQKSPIPGRLMQGLHKEAMGKAPSSRLIFLPLTDPPVLLSGSLISQAHSLLGGS